MPFYHSRTHPLQVRHIGDGTEGIMGRSIAERRGNDAGLGTLHHIEGELHDSVASKEVARIGCVDIDTRLGKRMAIEIECVALTEAVYSIVGHKVTSL